MTCFKEDLAYNIAFAKTMLKERGKLSPMVVGVVGKDRIVFPFRFSDDEEQRKLANIIKAELRRLKADALIVLTEAWTLKLRHPALYNPATRAKDHPNRKEGIVILYITKISTVRVIIPIIRVLDTVEFGEQSVLITKTVNDKVWGDAFKEGV